MNGVLIASTLILAAVGLYIAAYFTLVYYRVIEPRSRLMPRVCQLKDQTCRTVLETPYARVFGLPNSALGVLYYAGLITIVLTGQLATSFGLLLIVVSWFTVALGLFLAYALFFIIKIPCPLCLAAHAINTLVAAALTYVAL
jgi:uncharacterized membrane protein